VPAWPLLAWLAGQLIPAIGAAIPATRAAVMLQAWRCFCCTKLPSSAGHLLASPALQVSQAAQASSFRRRRSWNAGALEKALAANLTYRPHEDADGSVK